MLDFNIQEFEREEGLKISSDSNQEDALLQIIITGTLNRRMSHDHFLDSDTLNEMWDSDSHGFLKDTNKNRQRLIDVKKKYEFRRMKYSSRDDTLFAVTLMKSSKCDRKHQEKIALLKSIFPTINVKLTQSTNDFCMFEIALFSGSCFDDRQVPHVEGFDLRVTDGDAYFIDHDKNWKQLREVADLNGYEILSAETNYIYDMPVIWSISVSQK